MKSSALTPLVSGVLTALAASTVGCSPVPQTEIVVILSSDIPRESVLRSVHIVAQRSGATSPLLDEEYALRGMRFPLPGEVVLVANDPNDTRPISVRVIGDLGAQRLQLDAVVRFQRERTVYLHMPLSSGCLGANCSPGQTCRLGTCVAPETAVVTAIPPTGLLRQEDAADGASDVVDATAIDVADAADVAVDTGDAGVGDADVTDDVPSDRTEDVARDADTPDVSTEDTTPDVVRDVSTDSLPDVTIDVPIDIEMDVRTDLGTDVRTDVSMETDAGADVRDASDGSAADVGVPRPPSSQRSCAVPVAGCGLVEIPGGTFAMGSDVNCSAAPSDPSCVLEASPGQPRITVGSFAIDAYEVTVARFNAFWAVRARDLASTHASAVAYPNGQSIPWLQFGEPPLAYSSGNPQWNWSPTSTSRDAHPMNTLDWWAAQEFCVWDGGRLPTDAEWEFVARGRSVSGLTSGRIYPWGNELPNGTAGGLPPCDRGLWSGCAGAQDGGLTSRVGRFGAAGGVYDLAGNVAEWTADWVNPYDSPECWNRVPRTNPLCLVHNTGSKAFRGGSYETPLPELRSGSRNGNASTSRYSQVGFRCARTRCGDGFCSASENCQDCATDCGACVTRSSCPGGPTDHDCDTTSIPGGTFEMGHASPADLGAPVVPGVQVLPFRLDRFEVTVGRFRRFATSGAFRPAGTVNYPGVGGPRSMSVSVSPRLPLVASASSGNRLCTWTPSVGANEAAAVNCLTWATAQAFCVWDGGRLPTEAEWEYAARGTDGRRFPWGSDMPVGRACFNTAAPCLPGTFGDRGASPFGVFDLAGGLFEFTADAQRSYSDTFCLGTPSNRVSPLCQFPGDPRSTRGGSWDRTAPEAIDSTARLSAWLDDQDTLDITGFRCAYGP